MRREKEPLLRPQVSGLPPCTSSLIALPCSSRSPFRHAPPSPRSVRGFSKAALVIVDEAAFVPAAAYRALSPILAVSQGSLWALSTPYGQNGMFAELWHDQTNGWTRFLIPASECPRFTPEFLASERRLHGDISYAQEYECQFVSQGIQLLTRAQVAAAFRRDLYRALRRASLERRRAEGSALAISHTDSGKEDHRPDRRLHEGL